MPSSPYKYRPDVDGLRAIAVLAVIAFHVNAALVPGGFVGVDIFFVISGYLITGIIVKDIENKSFTFSGFYTRRIKRIFPAYIVVSLFTLLVASFLLIPNDYIFYTTSLAASWAFVSNIFFSMLSWGYFGQRTEEFPLLHTWSLSVEEQFYFVFPVLLIVLHRHLNKKLVPALLVIGALLLVTSQLQIGQVKSYFLITSRAHELLIGALTFYISRSRPIQSMAAATACTSVGLALMVGSMFIITRGIAFPGINSLYPCIGAALVIYGGGIQNPLRSLLANRVMVFVGLISYSLYLWHWPILSFLRYRKIEIGVEVGVAAVALSFVLSYLTWKFIENPIRRSGSINFKKAFLRIYLPPAMVCLLVGLYSYSTEGAPKRFSDETRELIASYSFERDLTRSCSIRAEDYNKITYDYLQKNCAFGNVERPEAEVLLMGDSHADHFKLFVDRLAKNADLKAVFHVQGACPPTSLHDTLSTSGEPPTTCEKRNADLMSISGKFRYVVLAGFWASEAKNTDLEKDLGKAVELIINAGSTPVLFKDTPYYEPDLSQCILHKRRGWTPPDKNCNIPYAFVSETQGPVDTAIDRVKSKYSKLILVDPKKIMCNSLECLTYIDNTALYKDANHLNAKASKLLGEEYIARVGNPLAGNKSGHLMNEGSASAAVSVRSAVR